MLVKREYKAATVHKGYFRAGRSYTLTLHRAPQIKQAPTSPS